MPAHHQEPSLAALGDFWGGERPLAQGQPRLWEWSSKTGISGARCSTCLGYKWETGTVGRNPTALVH